MAAAFNGRTEPYSPMASSYCAPDAAHAYVLAEVRAADRDRFLAALFAPEPQRRGLLALLAFDHELGRTRSVTREPMLARIRLEWWREAVAEAAGDGKPRAQPIVESLSETVRRHRVPEQRFVDLIDAREEEIDGPLDVVRAGHALADLQLAVLGVTDEPTRDAARAVGAAWLMGEGPERAALLAEARRRRAEVDPAALPILLPARLLDRPWAPWQKPVVLWWAARRGRY
jgi:Squalene/phytoene synthase